MEVFTIVANEVIGLSATECTLMQFSYNPEQIHDPESVLRSAVMDYLKTDEGKRQLEINCGCWNWGDVDDIPVKVSCDTLLHYEPTSKEVFVNVKSASKNEREKINQYVKDNGTFVSEDLVPMSLLQSVVSYGWEHWNRDFPE